MTMAEKIGVFEKIGDGRMTTPLMVNNFLWYLHYNKFFKRSNFQKILGILIKIIKYILIFD